VFVRTCQERPLADSKLHMRQRILQCSVPRVWPTQREQSQHWWHQGPRSRPSYTWSQYGRYDRPTEGQHTHSYSTCVKYKYTTSLAVDLRLEY